MSFFQPLGSTKPSYDDYISSVLSGNYSPEYTGISALKNSDILTAVTIIAGDIARFPLLKKDFTGNIEQDADLNYLLNVKSTGNVSARTWKFAMTVNAILTGNSFSRILRDPKTDKALQFQFYRPSETTVEETNDHRLIYTFRDRLTGKAIGCKAEDVIHWKFFSHDTILGRSPLLSLGSEISLQDGGLNTLIKFFRDGFSSGIIKLKGAQLNGEARKKARMDFEQMREGSTGGSPLVFDDTQEYTPLEIDTNVLQLITSNNFTTAQIAKALRVPSYKLGVNSPNQSVAQLAEDYVANDLPFYFDAITSELALKVLGDEERKLFKIEFDTRSVTGRNVDEITKLIINQVITPNEGRLEAVSAKSITDAFPEDNGDIVLEVNSNGGLVTVGSEIYTALKSYSGNVTVEVTGMAASAASVAIMGADKVLISPTAQIMIHKALYGYVSGNSDDLDKASNALKSSDKAIINAYVAKTGLSEEEILDMMRNETYMSASEAVEKGFADEVMSFDDVGAVASLENGLLPQAVIDDFYANRSKRKSEIQNMLREIEKEELLRGL